MQEAANKGKEDFGRFSQISLPKYCKSKVVYHRMLIVRYVKCNEVRPCCSNCLKHEIECDFAVNPPKEDKSPQEPPKAKRQRSNDTKSSLRSPDETTPITPHEGSKGGSHLSGRNLPPLRMEELELLHHFTTETCLTLSDREESHYLWRVVVPQIAFQHEFLMRGILAIAALHLSSLRPFMQDSYTHIAVQQQDAALRQFREVMVNPDESNCDAFFAMSSLIVVYGFESPKASNSLGMFNYKGEHSDEWLPLIRGVNSIIQSVWECVSKGRLSRLLHNHKHSVLGTDLPAALTERLELLEDFCDKMNGEQDDIVACKVAVAHLRWCFERIINKAPYECEVSLAFLWPVLIPPRFLTILNSMKPEALIILAHYCIILHHLDGYWWMKGWANHLINYIQHELPGGLQTWVLWPRDVIKLQADLLGHGSLQNSVQVSGVSIDQDVILDKPSDLARQESQET